MAYFPECWTLPLWDAFGFMEILTDIVVHYHGIHTFQSFKGPILWKTRFFVSSYINWSSLSLRTPRMMKTSDSCMVSAAQPLVTWRSYRLFRFSSFRYVTKGVIYIDRPPPRGDRRYPRGGVHPRGEVRCVQQWDSSVSQCRCSKLDTQIALLLVV